MENDEQLTVVIAGNYSEYQTYLRLHPELKRTKYASKPEDLAGIHDATIVYFGTYTHNSLYTTPQTVWDIDL